MMNRFCIIAIFAIVTPLMAIAADEPKAPGTVKALWADFDPRKDVLDTKVVREWEKDGIVYRYVTYHIGNFKGKPARMAAFFAFPKGEKMLPGLLQIHGGSQREIVRWQPSSPRSSSPNRVSRASTKRPNVRRL